MKTESVSAVHPVTPRDVSVASDPTATRALYARLESCGPARKIGLNLFRAHRCITQAMTCDPEYRQNARQITRKAHERKDWALRLLCRALMDHSVELRIPWGWSCDSRDKRASWTLHIDLPQGQVMFRNPCRLTGYDYVGRREYPDKSEERIIAYCDEVLQSQENAPRLLF